MSMSEQRVRLRPHTEADLPNYVVWLNDPEVVQFTTIEAGNITLEGEQEWFRQISAPDYPNRTWAIEADHRHIGNCTLIAEKDKQTAGFGIVIGDKTAWNQGFGTAALREALRIGFEKMKLHRIHLVVLTENIRGLRCYEKCGFRREGLSRKAFLKSGTWRDKYIMAILREEWEEQRQ
jgi:RimJ/RimL family protein N-acetyltransferase